MIKANNCPTMDCTLYPFFTHIIIHIRVKKDIVFRFIIDYSSLRDFGPYVIIIIGLFSYEDF